MLNKMFSVKEVDLHYLVKVFGIKFKIMNSKKAFAELKKLRLQMKRSQIPTIYSTNLTTEQKIWFLSQKFYEEVGYYPNFKNPKSFNEKINWMKLNYYNPLEDVCIDKYTFKEYIKAKLGKEYVIPAIGVYEDVNDIDFEKLPQRFVMKVTTSGSGEGVEVVKDKSKIDIDRLKYKFNNLLQEWNSIYYYCLSRGYKEIKPRIIIEKFVSEISQKPYEYKFFCFHGEPKLFYAVNYNGPKELTYYDMNLDQLPFTNGSYKMNKIKKLKPSKHFDQMVSIAKTISKDFPFVRVDFYDADKLYIGELTFTPTGGFAKYKPVEWDYKMGEILDLSKLPQERVNIIEELRTK